MNVELHASHAATSAVPAVLSWSSPMRAADGRSALSLLALVVATCLLGMPSAVAQDTVSPKIKTNNPKTSAKAKVPAADDDNEQKPAAASAKRDPVQAQRTFDSGVKLLQAGKAELAIQSFSSVISGGGVPPTLMARALHQRGVAYRTAGKPAQAVSDLTSALWLKGGLSDTERADAVQQRSTAYREAGLPDQSDSGEATKGAKRTASALQAGGAALTTSAPAAPAVTTASLAPEPARAAEPPSSPLGTLFGNLFGSGSSNAAAPASAAPVAAQPASQPATSAWSSATSTPPVPSTPKSTRAAAVVTPPPQPAVQASPATAAKAIASGSVHARMITGSEAEAGKLAGRLKNEFAAQMAGRAPEISQAQFGGMGSFFQVRVGPYRSPAEAQAFCAKIKASGADCVAVTQ